MNSSIPIPPGRFRGIIAVVSRDLRVWKRHFFSSLLGIFAEPLLYLLFLGYAVGNLMANVQGISYVQFVAPSLAVSSAMLAATYEGTYGTFTRLCPQPIFESILATPLGIFEIVVGEILFATLKATIAGCAVLIITAFFGLVPSPFAILSVLLVLLSGILFAGLAVLASSLSPSYAFFNYYFTLVVIPMFLFAGIFFPLDQLPEWARIVAWFSPMTHAASASRALFVGRLDLPLLFDTLWLLVVALLPWYPAVKLVQRRLIR